MMKNILRRILRSPFFQIVSGIIILMFFGGWIISYLEIGDDVTQGLNPFWWAIVTMTTVGYGDLTPKSDAGRLFAIIVMFGGISLTALLTATISSIFVAKRIREDKGLEKVNATNHILVCGWNHNAERVIDSLQNLCQEEKIDVILINDLNEDAIVSFKNKYRKLKLKFVRGDFTREAILERANVTEAETAIILPSDILDAQGHPDEKTIFATLTIKTLAPNVRVIAYIMDRENLTHIKRANADEVIISDDFGAYIVASHVMEPGVPQTVDQLLNSRSKSRFKRISIPDRFVGKPYSELFNFYRNKHSWLLVGVFSEDENIGIGAVLSSDTSALDAFIERKLKEAGHSLSDESKVAVVVNPDDDYIVQSNQKAIAIQ